MQSQLDIGADDEHTAPTERRRSGHRATVVAMESLDAERTRAATGVLDQPHAPQAVWAIWLFASSVLGFALFAATHPAFADKCDDFHTPPNDRTAWIIFASVLLISAFVAVALRRRMNLAWALVGLTVQGIVFWTILQPPAGSC